MHETMTKNMEIINSLNAVEGFEPSAFLRRLQTENGEEQLYLDVKYRKLWFRLKYPLGKITKRIVRLEDDYAIIESKVYLDRNDAEDHYISCAMAQRWRTEDDTYGKKYVESAETAAVGRALADAGFGIQFSEPGEERDPNPVDAPITLSKEDINNDTLQEDDPPLADDTTIEKGKKEGKSTAAKKNCGKTEVHETMSVDEIMERFTIEDAEEYVIPMGFYKGKTMGELCMEKPSALAWYLESYSGKNNILRAAAKRLLNATEERMR